MGDPRGRSALNRRDFLRMAAMATMLTACGKGGDDEPSAEPSAEGSASPSASATSGSSGAAGPEPVFTAPSDKLSGDLKILLWSHFVPAHDEWFDPFAKEWGKQAGVNVTVDHINNVDIVPRIAAEIQAGSGHDLIQYIAPLAQYEPSVMDMKDVAEEAARRFGEQLELCVKSSKNPVTGKHYAYAPAWAPDPGNYRRSMWDSIGMPDGPVTWDDLLAGGGRIKKDKGIQMGLGMSQEIDSNMVGRSLLWAYGGSIQDKDGKVVINSSETEAAVEFMARLYKETMTEQVFGWNPASNNQGLIAGQMSFIVNSISAWRTAQDQNPDVADDIRFVQALKGPKGAFAAQHVMYNWIIPSFAKNADAAKEFLLHYTANSKSVTYHSKLYDFPAFRGLVPELDGWLDSDPFGGKPADKLKVLKTATDWSVNVGYPGPMNTAEGEVFSTSIIPNMYAKAAKGDMTPKEAVADAEKQIKPIFDKWREKGLVAG